MASPTYSFRRVQYELRAAKQVERRMLLETLQELNSSAFPVRSMPYIGFGSVYFVDFILFHRFLGTTKMVSIEHAAGAKRRVEFNRPFRCVKVRIGEAVDVLAGLNHRRPFIVWLDFDSVVNESVIETTRIAADLLAPGSVLIVTVDVEPPEKVNPTPRASYAHYMSVARRWLSSGLGVEAFGEEKLASRNVEIIGRLIDQGMVRRHLRFLPLFNFLYADGHEMLTIGGIIGNDDLDRQLGLSAAIRSPWIRRSWADEPFRIEVPLLTRKERMLLDSSMPASSKWKPRKMLLDADDLAAYRETYRFLPTYAELML
jgi:putative O-methyltransferase